MFLIVAQDRDQSIRNEIHALRRKVGAHQCRTGDLEYKNASLLNQIEARQFCMEDLESEKE